MLYKAERHASQGKLYNNRCQHRCKMQEAANHVKQRQHTQEIYETQCGEKKSYIVVDHLDPLVLFRRGEMSRMSCQAW